MKRGLRLQPRLSAHESYVANILMIAMTMLPFLTLIWPPIARYLGPAWWMEVGARVAVSVIGAVIAGLLLRRSAKIGRGVTTLAYAHAFLGMGMMWIAAGFLVLLTGRTPSKIIHHSIPRITAIRYMGIGGSLSMIAVLCGLVVERRRHASPESNP